MSRPTHPVVWFTLDQSRQPCAARRVRTLFVEVYRCFTCGTQPAILRSHHIYERTPSPTYSRAPRERERRGAPGGKREGDLCQDHREAPARPVRITASRSHPRHAVGAAAGCQPQLSSRGCAVLGGSFPARLPAGSRAGDECAYTHTNTGPLENENSSDGLTPFLLRRMNFPEPAGSAETVPNS